MSLFGNLKEEKSNYIITQNQAIIADINFVCLNGC